MISGIKELIDKGRLQGFLQKSEIVEILPKDITDPEQVEDILLMISDMGISILDESGKREF